MPESSLPTSVSLHLDVLAEGAVTAVFVDRTSGNDAADMAARVVARSWRFLPTEEGRRAHVSVEFHDGRVDGVEAGRTKRAQERSPSPDEAYNARFPPKYPPSAARDGVERIARVRVWVTSAGQIVAVRIEQSSGNTDMDRAALVAVRQWRFHPGVMGGESVDGVTVVPVKFLAQP